MKTIIMVAIAALAYLLIIVFNQRKTWFALAAGLLVLALGLSAPQESWLESLRTGLLEHLNWNVMMIYLGSLLAAEFFILSGIPAKAAEAIAESAPSAGVAIALIALFTGLISAFVENVATLLVMAPIAIELARKMKVPLSPSSSSWPSPPTSRARPP
jgi:Na+/H+ antiporter NhaD/arsenite permease-like protein